MAGLGCQGDGSISPIGAEINISPCLQKEKGQLMMAAGAASMKTGSSMIVSLIQIGPCLQQQSDDRQRSVVPCQVQGGRSHPRPDRRIGSPF